jgi:cell division protein FtsI/penicillin-binding protein 2
MMDRSSPQNEYDYSERRITSLFFILLLIAAAVLVRLFQISVVENKSYLAQAQTQHRVTEEVPAHRGKILVQSFNSDEKYTLATNLSLYSV